MLEIMRGTTPTVTCHIDADLRNYVCKLEFGQPNTPNITVEDPTISYSSGSSTLVFTMTKEQSLKLRAGKCKAQVMAERNGTVVGTHLVDVRVWDPINPGVKHHGC